jgi:hypothetical protein
MDVSGIPPETPAHICQTVKQQRLSGCCRVSVRRTAPRIRTNAEPRRGPEVSLRLRVRARAPLNPFRPIDCAFRSTDGLLCRCFRMHGEGESPKRPAAFPSDAVQEFDRPAYRARLQPLAAPQPREARGSATRHRPRTCSSSLYGTASYAKESFGPGLASAGARGGVMRTHAQISTPPGPSHVQRTHPGRERPP